MPPELQEALDDMAEDIAAASRPADMAEDLAAAPRPAKRARRDETAAGQGAPAGLLLAATQHVYKAIMLHVLQC